MPCPIIIELSVLLLSDHCLSSLNALLKGISGSAIEGVRIVGNGDLKCIEVLVVVVVLALLLLQAAATLFALIDSFFNLMLGSDASDILVEEVSGGFERVIADGIKDVGIGVKLSSGEEDPSYLILIGYELVLAANRGFLTLYIDIVALELEGRKNNGGNLGDLRLVQADLRNCALLQIQRTNDSLYVCAIVVKRHFRTDLGHTALLLSCFFFGCQEEINALALICALTSLQIGEHQLCCIGLVVVTFGKRIQTSHFFVLQKN